MLLCQIQAMRFSHSFNYKIAYWNTITIKVKRSITACYFPKCRCCGFSFLFCLLYSFLFLIKLRPSSLGFEKKGEKEKSKREIYFEIKILFLRSKHFVSKYLVRLDKVALRIPFLLLGFLLINESIFANPIISYKKIDETLKKTWEETYPVEYKSITKKDLLGKGIMVVKNKQKQMEYMYSFQIFIPRVSMVDGVKTVMEDGKEIIVKLIHNPSNLEKQYRIELGEFSEKYYQGNVIRWIK